MILPTIISCIARLSVFEWIVRKDSQPRANLIRYLKKAWKKLICFFLPFIPPKCSLSKYDVEDTLKEFSQVADTAACKSSAADTLAEAASQDTVSPGQASSSVCKDKTEERSFFDFLISPDVNNLSGIGYMLYYTLDGLSIITLPASFVLFIIAFFIRVGKRRTYLLLSGFLCLIGFGILNEHLRYGYFVTLVVYFIAVALDLLIKRKEKAAE